MDQKYIYNNFNTVIFILSKMLSFISRIICISYYLLKSTDYQFCFLETYSVSCYLYGFIRSSSLHVVTLYWRVDIMLLCLRYIGSSYSCTLFFASWLFCHTALFGTFVKILEVSSTFSRLFELWESLNIHDWLADPTFCHLQSHYPLQSHCPCPHGH